MPPRRTTTPAGVVIAGTGKRQSGFSPGHHSSLQRGEETRDRRVPGPGGRSRTPPTQPQSHRGSRTPKITGRPHRRPPHRRDRATTPAARQTGTGPENPDLPTPPPDPLAPPRERPRLRRPQHRLCLAASSGGGEGREGERRGTRRRPGWNRPCRPGSPSI